MDDCNYGPLIEQWKPVIGFEEHYFISNYGKVKSNNSRWKSNYIMNTISTTPNTDGYLMFGARKNNKTTTILVHRMVAKCFIPNPENKAFANHNNGIKNDPFVLNICWMTASENTSHAWQNGMMKCTNHHRRPLTPSDVLKIREILKTENSLIKIATMFKVAPFAISKIRDNKTYKNII